MSLKYRRIVVDESALAPIAGRKLTFDKVCIVMRCKTFACIRGSSRFKISLAYRNRDTPGRFLFSNLSLFLSRSPSGATSAAFFRGPGLTWHTATTTGVTQRPAISFIEERRIRDESRAHETLSRRNRNVFQGGESASYSHPSFLSFSLYSDEKNIFPFTKKKISIDIRWKLIFIRRINMAVASRMWNGSFQRSHFKIWVSCWLKVFPFEFSR